MWVGGYRLDLYCENYTAKGPWDGNRDAHGHEYDEFPHVYTDEFGSRCRADARKDGWVLTSDSKAYCPKCSKKTKTASPRKKAKGDTAREEATTTEGAR